MDAQPAYIDQLIASGLLVPTGVDGLYGRSGLFEDVIARFEAIVTEIVAALGDFLDVHSEPQGTS